MKKERNNATKNHEWPLIGHPFNILFFYEKSIVSCNRRNYTPLSFQKALNQYPRVQARYGILLIQTGYKLERAIRILENKRKLRVSGLKDRILFYAHPEMPRREGKKTSRTSYIAQLEKVDILEENVFLLWHSILSSLIFQVSENLQQFMVCYNLTQLPQFKDVVKK